MSYCLNPHCRSPQNPDSAKFCSSCGFKLLLGDRYRALDSIASGGFGRTFLAVDEYKPSRPACVIKQFFPQQTIQDPERVQEIFRREAIQLEQLGKHPQIPELLAHFEQANYQYLVQEFINGQNLLKNLIKTGAFSETEIWHLLNDLLPVLDFIHSHQVIHRDIKPQNIIGRSTIGQPDCQTDCQTENYQSERQPYVLVDFGAAKSVTAVDLWRTGTSIGSPEFTAPEQAIGKATFASDLYSLGVTCIYLLTQVRPADLFDTQEGVWVWRHHLERPINLVLGNLIDKLLQGPMKLRYQSAAEVLHDLHSPSIRESLGLAIDRNSSAIAQSPSIEPRPTLNPPDLPETTAPMTQMPLSAVTGSDKWRCVHTLTDHTSWVRSVVIHPDGQTLASGSGDKTIRFWQLETGQLLRTTPAHAAWVRAIATSPKNQLLASCSNDKTVKLWNWQTGKLLQALEGHSDWVRAVAFSPDGRLLASSSQDKTIRLWNAATGNLLQTLTGHSHWVIAIGLSADGRTLVSGSRDKTIRVWDLQLGRSIELEGHTHSVNAIAISPMGDIFASSCDDSTIRIWEMATGQLLHLLTGHEGAVNSLAISADSKLLISGSHDGTIKIWSLEAGVLLHTLAGHTGWVWSVAISPDGQTIASGSWDATIKLWQPQA